MTYRGEGGSKTMARDRPSPYDEGNVFLPHRDRGMARDRPSPYDEGNVFHHRDRGMARDRPSPYGERGRFFTKKNEKQKT